MGRLLHFLLILFISYSIIFPINTGVTWTGISSYNAEAAPVKPKPKPPVPKPKPKPPVAKPKPKPISGSITKNVKASDKVQRNLLIRQHTTIAKGNAAFKHVDIPKNQRGAFQNDVRAITLKSDIVVYRRYGGVSTAEGRWFSLKSYKSAASAKRALALPYRNKADKNSKYIIKAGTTLLVGSATSRVGKKGFGKDAVGGGMQVYIPKSSLATMVK